MSPIERLPRAAKVGLIGAAVAVVFGLVRVRPVLRAVAELAQQRAALEQELARGPAQPARSLEGELDRLEDERDALRARVAEREARIAAPAERADLELRVVALAESAGLSLVAQETPPATPPTRGAAAGPVSASDGQRRWTLRGGFAGLYAFLQRLPELPRRVIVQGLAVELPPQRPGRAPASAGDDGLVIRMTVGP